MTNVSKTRKANGNGYTFKVGGSWKTVIEVNGQKITATNKSQQESRRLAKERAAQARISNKGIIPGANKVLLKQHLVPYLEKNHSMNIANTTLVRYLGLCKNYVEPALGNIPLHKLTKADITNFRNSMTANGIGGRTTNQALSAISVALDGAVETGLIQVNVAKDVKKVPVNSKPINPLTQNEMLTLLKNSDGTFMHARLHLAFIGVRQGEVIGLRWSQIDFDNREIHLVEQIQKVNKKPTVVDLKSKSSKRTLSFDEETANALKAHKVILTKMRLKAGPAWNDEDLVFPGSKGAPLSSKTDWRRWSKLLEKSGIKHYRLHDARHTAGTLLHANGVGIETIKQVLGHSSSSLTSRTYVHPHSKPAQQAAKTMNNIFAKSHDVA